MEEGKRAHDELELPLTAAVQQEWYRDHEDPRCPHDSWLARFELVIEGSSQHERDCDISLIISLLSAYHSGVIKFTYDGVVERSVVLNAPSRVFRRRDWLHDTLVVTADDALRHEIQWEDHVWAIEARHIRYSWRPHISGSPEH